MCGGCKYDFASADYRERKISELHDLTLTDAPRWVSAGMRRRGDFCFAGNQFGLFESMSKNIVPVRNCPNMVDEINAVLPHEADLPWCGAGSCLITSCENGIDITINSDVPYFTPEFKDAVEKVGAIRVVWNDKIVIQTVKPMIKFGDVLVEYPSGLLY